MRNTSEGHNGPTDNGCSQANPSTKHVRVDANTEGYASTWDTKCVGANLRSAPTDIIPRLCRLSRSGQKYRAK